MKSKDSSNRSSGRMARILTIAIAFVALLYFYPHLSEDELYNYDTGQQWQHEDLVSQLDFNVAPDSVQQRNIVDSVRNNFTYYYTPVKVNAATVADSVNAALDKAFAALKSDTTMSVDALMSARGTITRNVRSVMAKSYAHNVLASRPGVPRPTQIVVSREGNTLDDQFSMSDDIVEELSRQLDELGFAEVLELADIGRFIVPNAKMDTLTSDEAMANRIAAAMDEQTRKISHGDLIIKKGAVVTKHDARAIDQYSQLLIASGKGETRSALLTWLGQALYIALLLGCLVVYIAVFEDKIWKSARNFGFIIGLVTIFVVLGSILSTFLSLGLYIMPIAIVPILIQVFFNARMALWSGLLTALLYAGMTASGFEYFVIQFCGISAAVFSLRDLTKRSQLLQTSALVGVAYIIAYVAYGWLMHGSFDGLMWRMVGVLALNAVFTSMAYVLMFAVERMFGYISNVTLVELSDVNAPLLRALSDECPGTFNHVVAVSNLADDAARQIGANALLTRAGAMYHDIGKLSNPMFFTENQHGVNPHDGLSPLKSAEIIISHVTDGLRRAEKAGLPPVIRDFISEHHGAGQAKYFYFTYCKSHPDEKVDPAPFTYPGPNPRTRETSVLMMADAVEAASRSLKEHTPKAITDLVNKIIDGQIADGLHNDSPLSFHDIKTIKQVFIRRLMTMYHSRIAYPDDPNKNKAAQPAPESK